MDETADEAAPPWLLAARRAWKEPSSAPKDKKWTAYWIERFLVYLRRRNGGALPETTPRYGVVASFCRFAEDQWKCEEWKVAQARKALEWLAEYGGFEGRRAAERFERRTDVAAELPSLPSPAMLDGRFKRGFAEWADAVVAECRKAGLSIRTEKTYEQWRRRFSAWWERLADAKRQPPEIGGLASVVETAVAGFLDHLAVEQGVAAATQRQALNALALLVSKALGMETLDFSDFTRGKAKRNLPVVLSPDEVSGLLAALEGQTRLVAELLYGSGLRLLEAASLRVKDVDFSNRMIVVKDGK